MPLAALSILLAGCGSNSTPSGACTTATPAGAVAFIGTIDFGAAQLSNGTDDIIDATLYPNYGGAALTTSCAGTQMGNCCYTPNNSNCPYPDPVSAGVLTANNGSTQLGQLNFTAGTGYSDLDTFSEPAVTWQAGDTLEISAPGQSGMIAAFSGQTIAPAPLANVAPAINNASLNIPKASDFTVTWTPGTGNAQVALLLEDIALNGIACNVPVTAGTVTVPSALLQKFGGAGSLSIEPYAQEIVTSANASIIVRAEGNSASGQATYP